MSDKPKDNTPISLVAVERGYVANRLVEPGVTFLFRPYGINGELRKLPKWAVPAAEAPKAPVAKPVMADTKPVDAQAAVRKKSGQLAGNELA